MNLYRATCRHVNRTVYILAPSLIAADLRAHQFFKDQVGQADAAERRYVPDSIELIAHDHDVLEARDLEAA